MIYKDAHCHAWLLGHENLSTARCTARSDVSHRQRKARSAAVKRRSRRSPALMALEKSAHPIGNKIDRGLVKLRVHGQGQVFVRPLFANRETTDPMPEIG